MHERREINVNNGFFVGIFPLLEPVLIIDFYNLFLLLSEEEEEDRKKKKIIVVMSEKGDHKKWW